MQITRKLEFDAGHRVLKHESKCRHLHGHRYVVELTVEADQLDALGRVVDFSVLKSVVGGWVDEHWDHNILLHPEDPLWQVWDSELVQPEFSDSVFGSKMPYMMPTDCNPTAENLAMVLFNIASSLLRDTALRVVHVRIYETPNCWADYIGR
jgi:6-pyruvoyltetrahydropterin/6-carboxytetrahydropterin synthase